MVLNRSLISLGPVQGLDTALEMDTKRLRGPKDGPKSFFGKPLSWSGSDTALEVDTKLLKASKDGPKSFFSNP